MCTEQLVSTQWIDTPSIPHHEVEPASVQPSVILLLSLFLCFSCCFSVFLFVSFSNFLLPSFPQGITPSLHQRGACVAVLFFCLSSLPIDVLESSVHIPVTDHFCMMEGCMSMYQHDLEQELKLCDCVFMYARGWVALFNFAYAV